MAKGSSFKNVSGHPLDVGGRTLGADEFADLDGAEDDVKALVEAGQLAPASEPTKKEG